MLGDLDRCVRLTWTICDELVGFRVLGRVVAYSILLEHMRGSSRFMRICFHVHESRRQHRHPSRLARGQTIAERFPCGCQVHSCVAPRPGVSQYRLRCAATPQRACCSYWVRSTHAALRPAPDSVHPESFKTLKLTPSISIHGEQSKVTLALKEMSDSCLCADKLPPHCSELFSAACGS